MIVAETIILAASKAGASSVEVILKVVDAEPFSIEMTAPGYERAMFHGSNLFMCLIEVRTLLERDGLLLCCQGSRPNVFPSGMQQQMNGGRFAYQLQPGRKSTNDDVVDVFAPAELAEVGTVLQQRNLVMDFFGLSQ
jgi:hypothetical protein